MNHETPSNIIPDYEAPLPPDEAVTVPSQMAAAASPAAPSYHEPTALPLTIDEVLLAQPRRRWLLPLVLFLATCFTTFMSGVHAWRLDFLTIDGATSKWIDARWQDGLTYMVCVMAILLAHEMGHFLMTLRYQGARELSHVYPVSIPVHRHDGCGDRHGFEPRESPPAF